MQRDRHLASGDLRRHCQTKFCTACLRAGTRWSSTVFAHELPPRSASFEAENGLYLFALTMPGGGLNNRAEIRISRFDDANGRCSGFEV